MKDAILLQMRTLYTHLRNGGAHDPQCRYVHLSGCSFWWDVSSDEGCF